MGSFVNAVKRVVKWIGGCISRVISWWRSFRDDVDQKTINYIIIYQTVILNADNPETFGEVKRDKESIDSLLANRDY